MTLFHQLITVFIRFPITLILSIYCFITYSISWISIPVFILLNFIEYMVHKYLQHSKNGILYERHVKGHHKQFPSTKFYQTLFDIVDNVMHPFAFFLVMLLGFVIILFVPSISFIFFFYYFIMESMHVLSHCKFYFHSNLHIFHHKNPKKNFNICIPLWDVIFGTYERNTNSKRTAL